MNDSAEEIAETTRLLAYVSVAVVQHAPSAPDVAHDESARRLAGYLFDMPEAARSDAYANAMRNSGAARLLLPYRIHRAGYTDAVEAAQAAVGTDSNPVVGLAVSGTTLTVTFEDGTTDTLPLAGDGTDQTARDSAEAAQGTADTAITDAGAAQSEADAAALAAVHAQSTATGAQADITDHEDNHPDGTDQVARTAAAAAQTTATGAQTDITDHEDNHPDGTDQTARDSAATAQTAAEAANTLAGTKDDAYPWATEGNSDTMPAAKHRLALTDARGAVAGAGSNAIVDDESDTAIRGWSLQHLVRLLTRKVEAWARKGANTLIPPTALFGVNHATDRLVAISTAGAFQLIEADTPDAGTPAEPITLHAFANVGSGWREIDLTQPITTGFLVEFRIADVGSGGGEYALATADAILATTPTSSAPTNYNGALPLKTMQAENTGFGHDVIIVRKSDEDTKLWVKTGRSTANSWQIIAYPLYGRGVS